MLTGSKPERTQTQTLSILNENPVVEKKIYKNVYWKMVPWYVQLNTILLEKQRTIFKKVFPS